MSRLSANFKLSILVYEVKLRKGLDTVESLSVEASEFTKTRAFPTKSGQNISNSVGEKVSDLGAGVDNSW